MLTICEAHRDGRRCSHIANCTVTLKGIGKKFRVCGLCASVLKTSPDRIRLMFDAPVHHEGDIEIKLGKSDEYKGSFMVTAVDADGMRHNVKVRQCSPGDRN